MKDFVSNTIYVCLLFLDVKLNTKQGTAKVRIHLFMNEGKFIKRKIMNLQMIKNELTGWKILKQFFSVLNF